MMFVITVGGQILQDIIVKVVVIYLYVNGAVSQLIVIVKVLLMEI